MKKMIATIFSIFIFVSVFSTSVFAAYDFSKEDDMKTCIEVDIMPQYQKEYADRTVVTVYAQYIDSAILKWDDNSFGTTISKSFTTVIKYTSEGKTFYDRADYSKKTKKVSIWGLQISEDNPNYYVRTIITSPESYIYNCTDKTFSINTLTEDPFVYCKWNKDNNKWTFIINYGIYTDGWLQIDKKWYCFDKNGYLYQNCTTPDGFKVNSNGELIDTAAPPKINNMFNYHPIDALTLNGNITISYENTNKQNDTTDKSESTPAQPKNGWISDKSGWHVYKNDQMIKNDWYQDKSKWYYLDENGIMVTGWKKVSNKWYYFDASGAMTTGWKMIDNNWYYFKSSGEMHTGWLQIKSGAPWYYMNSGGKMVTGWNEICGKWYCFKSSGEMYADCTTPDGVKVGKDGAKIDTGNSSSSSTSTSTPPSTVSSYSEQQAYKDAGIAVHKLRNALKNPNSLILTLDTQSLTHYNNGISIIGITYSAMNGFGGYNTSIYLAYVYNGKAYAAGYTNEIDSLIQESRGMSGTTYKLDNEKILTYEP